MHAISSQSSIMQKLLTAPNGPTHPGSTPTGNTINEIAARTFRQNGTAFQHQNGSHNDSTSDWGADSSTFAISNNTPTMFLKCAECGLAKNSSEELEVHIKQEHLSWLPFQCPICLSERASDAQMREHLHSAHRKNMNKFIYVDNVSAKRNLQILMDRSFTHAMNNSNGSSRRGPMVALNGRSNNVLNLNTLTAQLMAQKDQKEPKDAISLVATPESANSPARSASPRVTVTACRKREHESNSVNGSLSTGSSNTDALLAQINAATSSAVANEEDSYEDPNDTLSLMFSSKRIKAEYEPEEDLRIHDESDFSANLNQDPSSVLEHLFSMNAAAGVGADPLMIANDEFNLNTKFGKVAPVTKKRVLGECSKCQKPVTAGARQMHMFYHLGKDHGIYRFRCKFDSCNIEHYRKDQMENHHSKVHGRIDPDMMEDRSLELYQRCQELSRELFVPSGTYTKQAEDKDLSMDLIGTNNCTPGPTAAKAQIAYNQQIAAHHKKQQEKQANKRKEGHESTWQNKAIPEDEHPLECKKCHKTMQNRIRGFHILWHLAKDLGINRYTCKFCEFGHDRSQSVQTHGKREHNNEDCVLDRIDEFETEIKEMSQECFGFQALFSQESRRRSKIPLAPRENASDSAGNSPTGDDDLAIIDDDDDKKEDIEDAESIETEEDDDGEEPTKATRTARKAPSNRRFGSRKPTSKTKRMEMTKLREISMRLGGAQYFKKKQNEAAHCEICGMLQHSRLSEHAYKHLNLPLFLCPHCDLGNYSRETVVKHIKEMHEDCGGGHPVDQRLKFAQEIKDMIGKCYPSFFVDAPIPTPTDIEKLKAQLGDDLKDMIAGEDSEVDDEQSLPDEEEGEEAEM